MSTTTTSNNTEQSTNSNRTTYAHLLAGGYEVILLICQREIFFSFAGTCGAVLTCPLEVIKTRYQSSQNAFSQENISTHSGSSMNASKAHSPLRPTIIGSLR